jgi:hypothetical protein
MEEVMLGSKRAISLWRQKRRLLSLERALAPERHADGKGFMSAQALVAARARDRLATQSKKKARFVER